MSETSRVYVDPRVTEYSILAIQLGRTTPHVYLDIMSDGAEDLPAAIQPLSDPEK